MAHDLTVGYHEPVEITKETLRALFLKDQTVKAAELAGLPMQDTTTNTSKLVLGSYNPLLNLLYIDIYMYYECTPDQTNKQIESTGCCLNPTRLNHSCCCLNPTRLNHSCC